MHGDSANRSQKTVDRIFALIGIDQQLDLGDATALRAPGRITAERPALIIFRINDEAHLGIVPIERVNRNASRRGAGKMRAFRGMSIGYEIADGVRAIGVRMNTFQGRCRA